jgi:predicted CXXCH cytochrome family protein
MRKTRSDSDRDRLRAVIGALCLLGPATASAVSAQTTSDIVNTKHNLSVSGLGVARASTETRICIFCHTPHNATPLSPLWNKELEAQVYNVYASPTLKAGPLPQPSGPTKLCLSCHDGTIAMGAVVTPSGGITMSGGNTLPPGSLSDLGLDLSGHHPVSFPYHNALPNAELQATPPSELTYGGVDEVHCITCHDPHKDLYGKFLIKDNRYSELCTTCHQIAGWQGSDHATSRASVVGILPRPPKTWPTYTQLNEWGCEACHTPHFARTAEHLLDFTAGPPAASCITGGCHEWPDSPHLGVDGRLTGGSVNIARQVRKISAHHDLPGQVVTSLAGTGRSPGTAFPGVGCADCHNPHVGSTQAAEAPYASGLLRGVRGIDRNGGIVRASTYEYEVCFRCHGDGSPDLDYVKRVVAGTNTRLAFAVENSSFHPVVGSGKNLNIPSIPSSFEPAMSASQQIYCTSCHADDEGGSKGPHGSAFPPILKERYERADNTPETFDNYALCYRCHDRSSILRDESFKRKSFGQTPTGGGHSGHLVAGAPCSACHDPHGVNEGGALGTGSHTHLINFDVRIVSPGTGTATPVFVDTGTFSGSCTLMCHGVAHDNASYP